MNSFSTGAMVNPFTTILVHDLRFLSSKESGLVVPGDARWVALTDLNGDSKPDIVVTVNDAELRVFEAR